MLQATAFAAKTKLGDPSMTTSPIRTRSIAPSKASSEWCLPIPVAGGWLRHSSNIDAHGSVPHHTRHGRHCKIDGVVWKAKVGVQLLRLSRGKCCDAHAHIHTFPAHFAAPEAMREEVRADTLSPAKQ